MKSSLPLPKIKHTLAIIFALVLVYAPIAVLSYFIFKSSQGVDKLQMSYEEVKSAQENFRENLSDELFNEHLSLIEKRNLEDKLALLEEEITVIKNSPEGSLVYNVNEVYELYGDFEAKIKRNDNVKLETEDALKKLESWGKLLIEQDFSGLKSELDTGIKNLDEDYAEYVASLPPLPPPPSSGYTYTTVSTEKGSFGVSLIKLPLSQVRVKTTSASGDDCKDNCPTKPLHEHINDNGGFAGINGAYFCPPDYSSCGGKVNSFDYALYHSSKGRWINKGALGWSKTGLMTFKGGSAEFYKKSTDYGGGSVDAGVSNYPSLLKNGEVVVKDGDMTSYQKVKGTRGAIGTGGENIYLAIIYNATVEETAYAMRALGAQNALNLDGGGSSAMYIDGRYVVGPGRSLPSAIVLTR